MRWARQAGIGGWHTGPEALGWLEKEAGGWSDGNSGEGQIAGRADLITPDGI